MKKDYSKGFVHNCHIKIHNKDMAKKHALFTQKEDGSVIACLDGYAIIPKDDYEALKESSKSDRPKLPGGGGTVRPKP